MSLNWSSGKSLFGWEINFKTVLSVSVSIWKNWTFSIKYFLFKATIFFCGKQKVSRRSLMKLLRYRFANISNLPNINRVVSFISFLFFTAKDLILADSLLLNSTTIFIFLRLRKSTIFSSINLFLLLLFFSEMNQCHLILLTFVFQTIFFLPRTLVCPYWVEMF